MNDFALSLLLLGALSSGTQLPFWMSANQFGLMPEGSGGLALVRAGTQYDASKEFQWKWGMSVGANYDSRCPVEPGMTDAKTADFNLMVDELYGSVKWKVLSLDVGMKRFDLDFYGAGTPTLGSMSATGGHLVWSGNARTMPGYLLTVEPFPVPFTNKVFWLEGAYGDFRTLDNRYVQGALIHRTKFMMIFKVSPRLDVRLGLDHIAMWGGTSPQDGAMPITLNNYFRVVTGRNASSKGTVNDQMNVIGDQRGGTVFRIDWRGDGWKTAIQRDIPYDDGSGMPGIQNWPDGVYTGWFGFDDKDRWISDIVYEYHYTMKQSGVYHDRPTTEEERKELDPNDPYSYWVHVYGGADNYFNHSSYKSGWTYWGRTIGDPLLSPMGTHAGTWTSRNTVMGIENNRIKAHHLSIAGKAFKRLPYKLMLTYSQNYGTYRNQYLGESQYKKPWGTVKETPLHQVSGAFFGEVPLAAARILAPHSPLRHLTLTYTLSADRGQLLPDTFGATLGLRWDWGVR